MSSVLSGARLIVVAPKVGVGGVGDYSQDLVDAVRPHVGELVEHRTGQPGDDSVAELRRQNAAIREMVATAPGPVLVHTELSGGAVAGFWGTAGLPDEVPVTATIHDPPTRSGGRPAPGSSPDIGCSTTRSTSRCVRCRTAFSAGGCGRRPRSC